MAVGIHTSELEVRVSRGLGPKGYGKVRVSAITSGPHAPKASFNFTYSSRFRYRWTNNFLHSALIDLEPGVHEMKIGSEAILVTLPKPEIGIRALFFSDPCFSSAYVRCDFGESFDMLNRDISLLNAAFDAPVGSVKPELLAIVGDNFYDQGGDLSTIFFSRLSRFVKQSFLLVVNGNHDNWVCGDPFCGSPDDQQGYGHMQYFPMDSVATLEKMGGNDGSGFLAFDIDPDVPPKLLAPVHAAQRVPQLLLCIIAFVIFCFLGIRTLRGQCCRACRPGVKHADKTEFSTLPSEDEPGVVGNALSDSRTPPCQLVSRSPSCVLTGCAFLALFAACLIEFPQPWHRFMNSPSNFIWYHRLGNLGLVGFSGAGTWSETKPHLEDACQYFGTQVDLAAIILLGHWNIPGMGCSSDMTTSAVRHAMSAMPGCARFGELLKYIDGHSHCNVVEQWGRNGEAIGFRIGGHGMIGTHCLGGEHGFLFLDSTEGRLKIFYFDIQSGAKGDHFPELAKCVNKSSFAGCTHLAETWLDIDTSVASQKLL